MEDSKTDAVIRRKNVKKLRKYTKKDLVQYCKNNRIEVHQGMVKMQIINAILKSKKPSEEMDNQQLTELIRDQKVNQLKRVSVERLEQYCEDHDIKNCQGLYKSEMISLIQKSLESPRLIHISPEPIQFDRDMVYIQMWDSKPKGFWFAVADQWRLWAHEEDGHRGEYLDFYRSYQINVRPDSYTTVKRRRKSNGPRKIFIVETIDDIYYIEREYAITDVEKLYWDYIRVTGEELVEMMAEEEWQEETPEELEEIYESLRDFGNQSKLDWIKFAERYGGIEIRNFNEDFRCPHFWYSVFDVSSTCVWNLELLDDPTELPN